MSLKWQGSIVSVDCGSVLGIFEGEISNIDIDNQALSLINVSRNSVKCSVPEITLSTHDIKDLKLLKSSVSKECNAVSNFTSEVPSAVQTSFSNKESANSSVYDDCQNKKGDGKKKKMKGAEGKKRLKEKDVACFFNIPVDSEVLDTDFDFEKNLALFDKQKVFDEINACSKSDQLKLVDYNRRGGTAKYRHDENILSGFIPLPLQISVPCKPGKDYVTDSGLTVPSVSVEFKKLLYKKSEEVGFPLRVIVEMIGRAASEMVLQLLGGNHRLNPHNTHQRPTVVILSGTHLQGAQGINCGRHLANHCVNVTVFSVSLSNVEHCMFSNEFDLFKLCTGQIVRNVSDLPSPVDIIIDALDLLDGSKPSSPSLVASARNWVKLSKATLVFLDPPPDCKCEEKNIILSPALPFSFENEKCSLNICDIGLPQDIFSSLGCSYSSPFGSKFIVSLYPKQQQKD